MSRYRFEPESRLEGFSASSDTVQAMQTAPDYWLAWYSFKSIALVAAVAALAYYVGKSSRRPALGCHRRRRRS